MRTPWLSSAKDAGIATHVLRLPEFDSRRAWDRELTRVCSSYAPELVISAGFLKLVGSDFLTAFGGRYLNSHNALLPSFPGIPGPADALAYGVKVTGATLFVVDEGVDTGVIVAQAAVTVEADDTVESLTDRIKSVECPQLVVSVGRLVREGFRVEGRRVLIGR